MSTSFSLSASDDLLGESSLSVHMSTGVANIWLDVILPARDKSAGTIGVVCTYQLAGCLARIKPFLGTKEEDGDVRRLAAVLFAAQMFGFDVVYS